MIASWGPGVRLEMNQVNFNCYHIQLDIAKRKSMFTSEIGIKEINCKDTKKFYFIYARMSEGLNAVLKILVRKNKKIPYSGTSIS